MAFAYTVDAVMTTGKMKYCQKVGPNMIRYTGTFTLTAPTTSGTIDLTDTTKTNVVIAATKITAYDVLITSGTVTAQLESKPNAIGAGTAADGKIGILVAATDIVGTWWADVVV